MNEEFKEEKRKKEKIIHFIKDEFFSIKCCFLSYNYQNLKDIFIFVLICSGNYFDDN